MSQSIIGSDKLVVQLDEVSELVFYLGKAEPGTATSAAAWRVSKFTDDGAGELAETMADGNAQFDNIWDNRVSLSYS